MYKIFLVLFIVASLNAKMIDGVGIIVKEEIITLLDIKKEMIFSKIDSKKASDILIRKKLEDLEIKNRKINVSSSEVYEEIKKSATRNGLSVSKFYEVIRESNGLNSTELKEKIKRQLLSQKLYSSIAYSSLSEPDDSEVKEYYKLHKKDFLNPSGFKVVIYQSKNKKKLQEKIKNPMLNSPDVLTQKKDLSYDKISLQLASLLKNTPVNNFSSIISNGKNGYMSFYVKEIKEIKQKELKSVKNIIINQILTEKREQVLSDYFARLRNNADIKIVRMPK